MPCRTSAARAVCCRASWRRDGVSSGRATPALHGAAEDGPRLLHRLAVNLEVQALAGRAKETGNKRLARLWWGLRHEVVPFADVPFVEELTRNGLGAIVENVLQGFLTQAEANEAELEASRLDEDGNP